MNKVVAEVKVTLRQFKLERDTWEAVALQYKAAFEAQTRRLSELQDICFATQAELENERAEQRRLRLNLLSTHSVSLSTSDGTGESNINPGCYGTATMFLPNMHSTNQRRSDECSNPLFMRVEQYIAQRNYGTALSEVERLLRGPLSPKARTEGLLLKSIILRATGPEELYEALAACSEALELCDRISELESFIPHVQYQRAMLDDQLRMLHRTREVFETAQDNLCHCSDKHRRSCDENLNMQRTANRRSGFEEHRDHINGGLLAHLEEKESEVCPGLSHPPALKVSDSL